MLFYNSCYAGTFKKHLKKILKTYINKKIFIVDNVSFYHAKSLKPLLKAHLELESCYLQANSPDIFYSRKSVVVYMQKYYTYSIFKLSK
ncbi:MAG: transposase [Cytophagaceae bacterium]|nr:transposase [Cytophagaceae bacterium]